MSTTIEWTDSVGAASLSNGKPSPGDRFANWNPRSVPFADFEWALGTAALHVFEYREDHIAAFDLVGVPYASLNEMLRLQNHLLGGATVQVTTGDSLSSVYPTCSLAPDADVTIELTDKTMLEYTMSFVLLNTASPRLPMLAVY